MNQTLNVDICVIGGGAGGLSVAAGAVQMGASVALVEHGKMGGDCLNYGCVPSKSLLAAAKVAETFRRADQFGIASTEPYVDMASIMAHVQKVIATIAVHDSVERFTGLGVKVIQAEAKFFDKNTIIAGNTTIKARRFVIATGSSPAIPPIAGLQVTPFYTNETIFELTETPEHLIVIGGGPIGCELAQAFLLLGVKVTLLEAAKILPRDEQNLVAILRKKLHADGLQLYEDVQVIQVDRFNNQVEITIEQNGVQKKIFGTHLLVATGRKANVEKLDLVKANVKYTAKGIQVDARLRTTNRRIFAIGDVVGEYQFTHIASYHAGIVIRNCLFRLPAKVDYRAVPWVTYTHPELAHVGLTTEAALKRDPKAKIIECPFTDNDRAQAEHETIGKIKVITTAKGKILGVSILGACAGELLTPWIVAIQENKSIGNMTSFIAPYPTFSEISKRVAGAYYKPVLFSKRTKQIVRLLKLLG